jgi:peptidyl-prolyl cis-trans isomerase SurA
MLGSAILPLAGWAQDSPPISEAPPSEVVDRIVAVVGDEVVLLSEVDEELYLANARGDLTLDDEAAIQRERAAVLDELVEAKILLEEARRQAIRVERAEIDRAVEASIADVRRRFASEDAFLAQLRDEGLSLDHLRSSQRAKVEEQLMVRQLVDRSVRSRVNVEDAEVREYWEQHQAEIPRVPAGLSLSRIVVRFDESGAVDSAAVRRAEIVKGRLEAGEDFATLARVFSEGPGADQGGEIGWLKREDLDPDVAAAVAELGAGETSEVIVTSRGAQILRVDEVDSEKGLRLRQIVFLRDEEAARASARARAESILARLRSGEDFATLAQAESDDQASSARGGKLGLVALEALEPAYRTALEATETGGVSEIVEDTHGLSIFRIDAREGERDATFEDVRERIEEIVRARKGKELYDELLAAAREKTYVETRLDAPES